MRSSETGRLPCPMKSWMSASWGNAVEISGLRCGRVGVTPWKFRGNAVENFALAEALTLAKLLMYVLHCLIVIDEFPATDLAQKGLLLRKSGNRHSALSFRLRKNQTGSCRITTVFVRRTAQKRVITKK